VSRSWLVQVENGKPSFDMVTVLAVFGALSLNLEVTDPEALGHE
jgi:hypothetical protein